MNVLSAPAKSDRPALVIQSHRGAGELRVWMNGPLESIRRESVDPFTPPDAFLRTVGEALDHAGVLFQALPWGGATAEVYWKLLDLGVQSFATDHP